MFNQKQKEIIKKVSKICKNMLNTLKTRMSFTKFHENFVKNKNRHLVNVNLIQQDKRSILMQL